MPSLPKRFQNRISSDDTKYATMQKQLLIILELF